MISAARLLNNRPGLKYDPDYGVSCVRIMLSSNGLWSARFEGRSMLGNELSDTICASSLNELDDDIKNGYSKDVREAYRTLRDKLETLRKDTSRVFEATHISI